MVFIPSWSRWFLWSINITASVKKDVFMIFKFNLIRHVTCQVKLEPLKSVRMEFSNDKHRKPEVFLSRMELNMQHKYDLEYMKSRGRGLR